MKIVIISDTHELHEELGTLRGDVLIHCGDSANGFNKSAQQVDELDDWFGRQHFARILVIGGNHDFELQTRSQTSVPVFKNAIYLEDETLEFGGINFYGAPWIPELATWAFYQPPEELPKRWALIPDSTHVLITHSPPFGILDRNSRGKQCGCPDLRERLDQIQPIVHCFGHVHASAGVVESGKTRFVNASMGNSRYELVRTPHQIEL